MNSREFASLVGGVRPAGDGFTGRCPAHEDRRASLSFRDSERGLLVKCHAGCSVEAITSALGLRVADLFEDNGAQSPRPSESRIVATYAYHDESGSLLYEVVRFAPKDFRQRRPDGRGGWVWNLDGVRRVLYRLPALRGQSVVYIGEGEKDADRLGVLGLAATTNPGGAGKWREEYTAQLTAAGVPEVVILPDNDPPGDAHALAVARSCLAARLAVKIVRLPGLPLKGDVSDWCAAGHTKEELLETVMAAPVVTEADLAPPDESPHHERRWSPGEKGEAPQDTGPYHVESGRICREKHTKDGPVVEPLCNFIASVAEELLLDDGVETRRAFLIEGRLDTGEPLPGVQVPASRFTGMAWVTESWGLRAVVRAGQATRDYLREAIQRLSPRVRERRVFTHTGWREISGEHVYLHAGGAVGCNSVEVDLGGPELARYRLPHEAQDPVGAMQASLRLLRMAPIKITAPLWAAVYRAPLTSAHPVDSSIWVEGQTGALKSTVAALFLCHYGDFDRTHLPGAWSSTGNSLERRAFTLKDALFVVDDYAPSGLDAREMETKAARLLRAQGNLAGRGRLRSDLSERPAFPPRGLILSTGEQHPPGQSLLARMLLVEVERADVNLAALTQAQQTAGQLPHAMAGYTAWLAPQMPTLHALLCETFEGARTQATVDGEHFRVPEALAHLWCGLHCGLTYAEEIGACSPTEADELRHECWEAFLALGRTQGRVVEEERPTRRFLSVLLTLVNQRRAIFLPKDEPSEGFKGVADLLGWQGDGALFLIPEAAFQAVNRFCREAGEPFPVRQERLKRDLAKEGLSECDPGRYTVTARIGGRTHRVLKLALEGVEALLEEEFPPLSPASPLSPVLGSRERCLIQ